MGDKTKDKDYYYTTCRTCLQSNGEMQDLSALINDNLRHGGEEISYMDCLEYCMRVDNGEVDMPTKICVDCASALQVAYWFMKNASKAQELLKVRMKELQEKRRQLERQAAPVEDLKKPKRYRCKICNTKLETKRSLKDHVKLHLDIIAYNCQLCPFEHHQRNYLIEHYQLVHGLAATPEQLKPKTKISPPKTSVTSTATRQCDNYVEEQQQQQEQPLPPPPCEVYVEPLSTHSHDIYTTQQNQNFVYTTSVNTSAITTPLEGNTTTTIFAQPNAETFTFNAFEGDLNVHNDLNVGNEFIVMADGTVENVMGKGVVIEYINSGDNGTLALENGLVLDNILQVQNAADTTNMLLAQNDMVQMDVDDLIIEDPENTPEQTQDVPSPIDEDMIPATFIEQPKRNNCKVCAKEYDTQDELKTHMLTHNEIPHFFCEQCTFYTFFKIDLHQHYKSKHNIQPSNKQLQPKNKQRSSEADMDQQTKNAIVQKIERYARSQRLVYCCDICFYECDLKYDIRRHYLSKHRMHVQDVQQRPSRANKPIQPISNATATQNDLHQTKAKSNVKVRIDSPPESMNAEPKPPSPDYLNGLNCRKCNEVFYYRNKLYEHYKLHSAEEEALRQQKQILKMQQPTQRVVNNLRQIQTQQEVIQPQQQPETQLQLQQQQHQTETQLQVQQHQQSDTTELQQLQQHQPEIQLQLQQQQEMQLELQQQQEMQLELHQQTDMQLQYQQDHTQPHLQIIQQLPQPHQEVVITTTPLDSLPTFNNVDPMSLVLTPNNTTLNNPAPLTPSSSSTYTLPSDAIPQIVEMEQTIETDMDFDFNGDALFEDFDDVDVENESDNDLRNIVLTSDDDFDDMLKEQGETQTQTTTSYCAQCQKSFLSQYQFENHMFLHRGLAPYRCEMCTNLYNTKRALIRHYNAVHKKIPSRDMIQAKGDKVYVYDKTPMDLVNIEESKATTLMCAKCTYESTDFPSVQLHLNTNHSIHDDSYILRKLSFECPRCIRSFSTKAKLLRHLERNHAATPINHPQTQINSSDTATTTTTTTTAPSLNNNVNMMQINTTCEHGALNGGQLEQHDIKTESTTGSADDKEINLEDECIGGSSSFVLTSPNIQVAFFNATTSESSKDISFNVSDPSTLIPKSEPDSSYSSDPQSATDPVTTDVVLYKCQICQESFSTIESVGQHAKRIECRDLIRLSKKECPLFKCEVCQNKYPTMYLLRNHLKKSHMVRSFRCSCCPKSYFSKIELEFHYRTHTDERHHKCDLCPSTFRYAHHLKRHKDIIHFGKRYICPEANCNRQFSSVDQLKVHKWSHFGIVPYKCRYCERLFKKRLLLRKHCWKFHKRHLTEDEMVENFRNSTSGCDDGGC